MLLAPGLVSRQLFNTDSLQGAEMIGPCWTWRRSSSVNLMVTGSSLSLMNSRVVSSSRSIYRDIAIDDFFAQPESEHLDEQQFDYRS
jgi:hypothetical protein